ncbi:MAG: class II aldolase/adducin family protein [Betaproteobacteria bacterium]|jgi:L-fuculose-phosphate aldolase
MTPAHDAANSIVSVMQRLDALGLNRGASGNCSVRTSVGFLITPSGIPPEKLTEAAMVTMSLSEPYQAGMVRGMAMPAANPSSEWRFHHDIYLQRPDVNAIVHCHSAFATSLACLHKEIPAFHYMIAVAGGSNIRCAPYALFGTQELSNQALQALQDRKACLLANHGMIAVGRDLADALGIAVEVESLCEQYWRALQIGEPILLSDAQMSDVMEKFKTYGPNKHG